jgi:hypothetical protein
MQQTTDLLYFDPISTSSSHYKCELVLIPLVGRHYQRLANTSAGDELFLPVDDEFNSKQEGRPQVLEAPSYA